MMWTKPLRAGLSLACLLTVGCNTAEKQEPQASVLATVAGHKITSADLDRVSARFGTDGTSDREQWRKSLQLLIDKQLLLAEGRSLGLHESQSVLAAAEANHRRSLTEALLEKRYGHRLKFTEEQVRAWFDSTGAGNEIQVRRAVIRERTVALKALREATSGKALDELDVAGGEVVSQGDLGWLSSLANRDPRLTPLFDREVGAVELIESEGLFFLMEVSDRREIPFAERSEVARSVLEGQRQAQVNMEYLEYLLAKYEVGVDTTAVQRLAAAVDASLLDPRTRLVQSALGDWSLGEYLRTTDLLKEDATDDVRAGTSALGFRLTRAFVVDQLLPLEASEEGLTDSLATLRQAVVKRGTIEALWATSGFTPESASREPERFDEYLEQLRVRFADRVELNEEAYLAYVAGKRQSEAPVEY
jgi:hypothetical protein